MPKAVSLIKNREECPSQWEGKLEDGRMFFINYRYGKLDVRVSQYPTDDIMDAVKGETMTEGIDYPDDKEPLDGVMDTKEMLSRTNDAIDWSMLPGTIKRIRNKEKQLARLLG